jgi:hypothetical protein
MAGECTLYAQRRMSDHAPLDDIVLEADRLLQAAATADLTLRLIGVLAVRAHAGGDPVIARACKDIDLVTPKGRGKRVSEFMAAMGYEADRSFNATNGHRRLLYYDPPHNRQVDIFVGTFEMCHSIPITDRIELHPSAVPLAELLLTKLQIVELNAKDQADILTILYHHDVAEDDGDGDAVNAARIAELCAGDWGLCRTTRLNVERTRDAIAGSVLTPEQQEVVRERLERLWERIESEPKSTKWKMRNRVGDKVRWYEEPEEVDG